MNANDMEETVKNVLDAMTNNDQFNNAVSVMRMACNTVLNRVKTNLDASVNEAASPQLQVLTNDLGNRLGSLSNTWIDQNSNQLMVVPEGTKYIHRDSKYLTIIVEQKPTVRNIMFFDDRFKISLPFVQFYIVLTTSANGRTDSFEKLKITCSKSPITSLESQVNHIPLPNISNTEVCVGNMNIPINRDSRNLIENVDMIINAYWGSQFNLDLNANLYNFFRLNFPDIAQSSMYSVQCFKAWQEKSSNPLWSLSDECKTVGSAIVGRLLPQDLASSTGKAALVSQMKQSVQEGVKSFVHNLTANMDQVDILEENRNQPHSANLALGMKQLLNIGYKMLWNGVHARHQAKVEADNRDLDTKRREVERVVSSSQSILDNIQRNKNSLQEEKLRVQSELYKVYSYLLSEIEKVSELKAKLSQWVDEEGNPLPTRRRGRPKKEELPDSVVISLNRVETSSEVVGPDGQPIKRKRGRPRKNPLPQAG